MDYNTLPNMDSENCSKDKRVKAVLSPGEQIILSLTLFKYNYKNIKQQRIFLLTNQFIYNIVPSNFLNRIISKITIAARIKRKIHISLWHSLSLTKYSTEFTLHVPTQYDYRYSSHQRDLILFHICTVYSAYHHDRMPFYYITDLTLIHFTTTKVDQKNKINRSPQQQPDYFTPEEFKKSLSKQQTSVEVIYSQSNQNSLKQQHISIQDFTVLKVLGRGAFGKVMLCEHQATKKLYAIKSLNKENIIQKKQVPSCWIEREILTQLSHPFLVKIDYAFQTSEKLFFVMPFLRGGELFYHLKIERKFSEDQARFYSIQLVMAIEYLHSQKFVYRDLKPENILLDEDGYLQLADFGLAKKLEPGEKANSFVGTPDYLAPEIIRNEPYSFQVDWWGMGIIMYHRYLQISYEMLTGFPPFYSQNANLIYKLILEKPLKFPVNIQPDACDLISQLLNKNPSQRLGAEKGGEEILKQPWFAKIKLDDILQKRIQAPFKPKLKGKYDVNNFDSEFTTEEPIFSQQQHDSQLLQNYDQDFNGMSYKKEINS